MTCINKKQKNMEEGKELVCFLHPVSQDGYTRVKRRRRSRSSSNKRKELCEIKVILLSLNQQPGTITSLTTPTAATFTIMTPALIIMVVSITSIVLTSFSVLKRSPEDRFPCMVSATMALARDLEEPGLPTRKSGMRSSTHTTIMNTFSFRAWLRAIFSPSFTFSSSKS